MSENRGGDIWTVYCDGSAVPNPGRMGLGAVLISQGGERQNLSVLAPGTGCNNEAELRAVMAALERLKQAGADRITLHCDNSVVVEQLTHPQARPIARLAPLFDEARSLLAAFGDARLVWLPGHRNGEADALARAALGIHENRVVKTARRRKSLR